MPRLIGVIDAGTNTIRFVIYKSPGFEGMITIHKVNQIKTFH